jgi:hypothetical protein
MDLKINIFKLVDSKVFKEKGTGKCFQLQISLNDDMHVLFTSSIGLIEAILQITEDQFPFSTIVIESDDRYAFT